jgi:hypothetical protein
MGAMSRLVGALFCAALLICAPARAATNGQLAAIARTAAGDRLVTLNADGSGLRTLLSGADLSTPAWSPDGNSIAVVDDDRLLLVDADGGPVRTLFTQPGVAGPTWAPDGQSLAFLDGPDPDVIDADGSDLQTLPLPFFGQLSWLRWSPDGALLAYGTSGMLRTYALAGGDDSPVVTGTMLGAPSWSPDATRVVYRDGGGLRIAPIGPGDPIDLVRTGGEAPAWSPDGTLIVYVYGADLRVIAPDGSNERTVSSATMLDQPAWQPCVDGVTVSCASPVPQPAPPPPPPAQSSPGPLKPNGPQAPNLDTIGHPRLDVHGRGWLRARCDADCTVSLRLVIRVHGHRYKGPVLTRTLKQGRELKVRLRGPERNRISRAWISGTVRDKAGHSRPLDIPIRLR